MNYSTPQPSVERYENLIAENNRRLLGEAMEIVKLLANDPEVDTEKIASHIKAMHGYNSGRFQNINEKRKLAARQRRPADALA